MTQISAEDYVQKIALLEKICGPVTTRQMLKPFSLDINDFCETQFAAKKIAGYIGLKGYTFIVTAVECKNGTSGHIDLKRGENEVFIEISNKLVKFGNAAAAILAHEITHTYLYTKGYNYKTEANQKRDNEVLTDVAAVYLGLGKLMLNGCRHQTVHKERWLFFTTSVVEEIRVGPLDMSQLAFVYLLVCAIRKITESEYIQGLSKESIQALQECEKHYGRYFNSI